MRPSYLPEALDPRSLAVLGTNSGDCGVTFLEDKGDPILILENWELRLVVVIGVLVFCRF